VSKNPARPVMAAPAKKDVVISAGGDAEAKTLEADKKWLDAFNKHDIKAYGEMIPDDYTAVFAAEPADTKGKKASIKSTTEFFKGMPDSSMAMTNAWTAGDYVFGIGTFSGTNTGGLPSMKIKKNDKKVSQPFIQIDKLKDGKVQTSWVFYDGMTFATQLGLVPPPGAAPAGKKGEEKAAAPAGKKGEEKAAAAPAAPAAPTATAAAPAKPAAPAAPAAPATATPPKGPTAVAPASAPAPAAPAAPKK
jgi:predicted ester cyclase